MCLDHKHTPLDQYVLYHLVLKVPEVILYMTIHNYITSSLNNINSQNALHQVPKILKTYHCLKIILPIFIVDQKKNSCIFEEFEKEILIFTDSLKEVSNRARREELHNSYNGK